MAVRDHASTEPAKPSAIDRAKKLTKPFGDDAGLDAWAAKLIGAADDFEKRKRPDPFNQFLIPK